MVKKIVRWWFGECLHIGKVSTLAADPAPQAVIMLAVFQGFGLRLIIREPGDKYRNRHPANPCNIFHDPTYLN